MTDKPVKRYDVTSHPSESNGIPTTRTMGTPNKEGAWCSASDVAALEAEIARLRRVENAAKELPITLAIELRQKGMPYSAKMIDNLKDALAYDAAPSPATAEAWVPTATQIGEIEMRYVGQPWSRRDAIRYAFIAGHRFKEESCSQSGSQLESWSSENSSSGLPTSTAGNRAAPTESASSSESVTRSIDARCEALFAKNEEWRPRSTISELRLINGIWFWWDKTNIREYVIPAVDTGTHLLAALLPRAVDKWCLKHSPVRNCDLRKYFWQTNHYPPRGLESAINILEKP